MPPNILSALVGFIMLFPYLFNFLIYFYYQKYYNNYYAFLYYCGLILSLLLSLVFKKVLSGIYSKKNALGHLRLDLIVNSFKKIVINKKKSCNIIESPLFPNLGILSLYTVFYGYLLGYFSLMDISKRKQGNVIYKFIFLVFLTTIHSIIQLYRNCSRLSELFLGLLVGIGCGVGWYYIVNKEDWNSETKNKQRDNEKRCKFYGNKYLCTKNN